jgi:hypothetical protein
MKSVGDGAVVDWAEASDEAETKERLRSLITIYEGSMNDRTDQSDRARAATSGLSITKGSGEAENSVPPCLLYQFFSSLRMRLAAPACH